MNRIHFYCRQRVYEAQVQAALENGRPRSFLALMSHNEERPVWTIPLGWAIAGRPANDCI